jgi:hypothetical protein
MMTIYANFTKHVNRQQERTKYNHGDFQVKPRYDLEKI